MHTCVKQMSCCIMYNCYSFTPPQEFYLPLHSGPHFITLSPDERLAAVSRLLAYGPAPRSQFTTCALAAAVLMRAACPLSPVQ